MSTYYNEIDPFAAHVLRTLIERDVIAPGEVDTRSIKEMHPDDISGFTQCHFFAGAGIWSAAARHAGWPDDRPFWSGSCPCQGESLAGKRLGADDPRHLWPDFYRLIRARRPPVVVGEQVAAAAGTHWLDRVCADLDDENYAFRAVDIPACAVDAPHQRQRIYWVSVANAARLGRSKAIREPRDDLAQDCARSSGRLECGNGADRLFADASRIGWGEGRPEHGVRSGRLSSPDIDALVQPDADKPFVQGQSPAGQQPIIESDAGALRNGSFWSDAEWVVSPLDGKARRVKSGIPFLVNGLANRIGGWRVAGNAIVLQEAAEVIAALMDVLPELDAA